MKCKNCRIELEQIEGKERKVFCSDKCRKAFNRKLTSDTHVNRWGKDVRDAEMLYAYIGVYPEDTWKDSPEFKELNLRLKKPVKWLRDNKYWIPNRLEK